MIVRKTIIVEKNEDGKKTIEVKRKESGNINNAEDLFNFLVGD